jgi:hypothetical protein
LKRVLFIFSTAVYLIAATQALAQSWPQQAIHFIISFGAGGGTDIVGRILADATQALLPHSISPASFSKLRAGVNLLHVPFRSSPEARQLDIPHIQKRRGRPASAGLTSTAIRSARGSS